MRYLIAILLALLFTAPVVNATEGSVDLLEQQAWQAAAENVAKSVVQIRTVGGLNRVGGTLISQGPTTGLIVSADGYIVSSAFNFAGQPNSILVRLATGEQLPAELIARDKNRLLVLLKVDSKESLPIAKTTGLDEIHVGQWAIAVGRTFDDDQVNVSVGIISGLNRRYGRVIQTDASISVANYGGPLVDVYGRSLGILVPMAPQGSGDAGSEDLAGAEFYDSGIGFAVPMTHVLSVLDRWQRGDDLLPGKMGVGLVSGPAAIAPPKISVIWPGSPAAVAGWKADDLIVAIDGQQVQTQAQLKFQIVPRYAGDTVSVTIRRGKEEINSDITLVGEMAPYRQAFLGVLPVRSSLSEEPTDLRVQSVWPNSPAAEAGLQAGDVIKRIGEKEMKSRQDALGVMETLQPKDLAKLVIIRAGEELALAAKLGELPVEILSQDQFPSAKFSPESEAELQPLKQLGMPQTAKFYDPAPDTEVSKGLLLWLAGGGKEEDQQLLGIWQEACQRDQLILLIAHPASENGWASDDLAYLDKLVSIARRRWQPDTQRTVVGGFEKAGQLAYAFAFAKQKEFSGVIGIDAPLPRSLKITANRPGSQFAVLAVESENSTFAPLIRNDLERIGKAGYPASWLKIKARTNNQSTLDTEVTDSLCRWINGLNRF